MITKEKIKLEKKQRRARRVRSRIFGTTKIPRMSVYKSLKQIYVQLIDDSTGKTLVSASSNEIKDKKSKKTDISFEVGQLAAKKAQEKKIKKVIFDKGSSKYHGRVKAVAEGARKGGLEF